MGNELTKIDRALECQVIDWLQWGNFEEKIGEPSMPELALKVISKRKLALTAEQEKVRKLTEALEWYKDLPMSEHDQLWTQDLADRCIDVAKQALKEIQGEE